MLNNYVNRISIYGLMNKFCVICDNIWGFWKTKSHTKLVSLDENIEGSPDKVSCMYLEEVKFNAEYWKERGYEMSRVMSEPEIYSAIKEDTVNPTRKSNAELYETIKHYALMKNFSVEHWKPEDTSDIMHMIEQWANTSGKKYGFIRHEGIDKALFLRLQKSEIDTNKLLIFVFKLGSEVVGYSVIENQPTDGEIVYLIRKCVRTSESGFNLRNLCLYIDWYTFKKVHDNCGDYVVNWGCSGGGVRQYKISKWPLYKEKPLYFYGLKKI